MDTKITLKTFIAYINEYLYKWLSGYHLFVHLFNWYFTTYLRIFHSNDNHQHYGKGSVLGLSPDHWQVAHTKELMAVVDILGFIQENRSGRPSLSMLMWLGGVSCHKSQYTYIYTHLMMPRYHMIVRFWRLTLNSKYTHRRTRYILICRAGAWTWEIIQVICNS